MSPVQIDLPGGQRTFRRLALDFTGTLSLDGRLLPGVGKRLRALAGEMEIVVLTADTVGTAKEELSGLPVEVRLISHGEEKARALATLGTEETIAIGNGRNDMQMLDSAGLGIAVLGPEGAAPGLLDVAQVVAGSIQDALDLVAHPLRLKATLRD